MKQFIERQIPLKEQRDKYRYVLIWVVAGLLILAYAIWLIIKVADSYAHPGAKIGVDPIQPPFPVFAVCFWDLANPLATPKVSALHTVRKGDTDKETPFIYSEFKPELFYEDGATYSKCVQFNAAGNTTVKANKGYVEIIVQAAYEKNTTHASVHLLILPAGSEFHEYTDPEKWDNIILPAEAYVDGRWTAQVRKDVNGKATTRYNLAQQSEPLTKARKRSLQQTKDYIDNLPECADPKPDGTPCQIDGVNGLCEQNECQFQCQPGEYVPLTWVCDYEDDCDGGEDEVGPCPAFTCLTGGEDVRADYYCNGIEDCTDGSDERNCTNYPIFVGATIQPYTQYVTVTEDYVTFGWESFFASLASGWSIIGVAIAFFFPEETATYLRWRGTKAKEEEEEGKKGGKEAAEMKSLAASPASPSAEPDRDE